MDLLLELLLELLLVLLLLLLLYVPYHVHLGGREAPPPRLLYKKNGRVAQADRNFNAL